MTQNFIKMNGAGNDFIIFDARKEQLSFAPQQIRAIAARENPITKGCDQLVIIEPDNFMRLYNADGSDTDACGNATRCIAWLLMEENNTDAIVIRTAAGDLHCERAGDHLVTVDMGMPRFANNDIPMVADIDRTHVPIEHGGLKDGVAVGMGNPHIIFFVPDSQTPELDKYGEVIEKQHTDIFPARVNVSAAQIIDPTHIRLRVWERGAGFTLACGTAACATLVAAAEKKLTARKAEIAMPGGVLTIDWRADNHVWMTGPVEEEFRGAL